MTVFLITSIGFANYTLRIEEITNGKQTYTAGYITMQYHLCELQSTVQ